MIFMLFGNKNDIINNWNYVPLSFLWKKEGGFMSESSSFTYKQQTVVIK